MKPAESRRPAGKLIAAAAASALGAIFPAFGTKPPGCELLNKTKCHRSGRGHGWSCSPPLHLRVPVIPAGWRASIVRGDCSEHRAPSQMDLLSV